MDILDITLVGFGNVGQGLAAILRDKDAALRQQYGVALRLTAVLTRSHGSLAHPDGLDPALLLQAAESGSLHHYPETRAHLPAAAPEALIRDLPADVVVELSPSDLQTAQPALAHCHAALSSDKHLVLANKGPVALAYHDLMAAAAQARRRVYFEATVMAGTPSLRLALDALAGCTIHSVRGILNGTTNFILTQMQEGQAYQDALRLAQRLGYAEADPSADVDGWDAAGKLLILANALFGGLAGSAAGLQALEVSGITGLTRENMLLAEQTGERYRLIAQATPQGGQVGLMRLPISDPLAHVTGVTNAITFRTDLMGDITLIGAGAGRQETGFAVLADLLALHRETARG